jgi:hypothetical protein
MASAGPIFEEVTMSHQTSLSSDVTPSSSVVEVLHSSKPSSELGSAAAVYDWLIGSWNVRVVDYDVDGTAHESRGEWHFGWVLEGRAVQDVFIVPSREERSTRLPKDGNRYGTSLRTYDPNIEAWRITWINPVRQVQNHLVGKKVGDEIVQEGLDENGSMSIRWCFREITENSFRWTGEESNDNGKTWQLGAEFFAVRMGAKSDSIGPKEK